MDNIQVLGVPTNPSNPPIDVDPSHPDAITVYCCDEYWFYSHTRYLWKYGPMPWYSTSIEVPEIPEGHFAYYQSPNWHVIDFDPRPEPEPEPEPEPPIESPVEPEGT